MPTIDYSESRWWNPRRESRSPNAAFYRSPTWKRARKGYLLERHYCEACIAVNRYGVKIRVVDHLVKIPNFGAYLDPDNFAGMCFKCHAFKTAWETNNPIPQDLLRKSEIEEFAYVPIDKNVLLKFIFETNGRN